MTNEFEKAHEPGGFSLLLPLFIRKFFTPKKKKIDRNRNLNKILIIFARFGAEAIQKNFKDLDSTCDAAIGHIVNKEVWLNCTYDAYGLISSSKEYSQVHDIAILCDYTNNPPHVWETKHIAMEISVYFEENSKPEKIRLMVGEHNE